MNKLDINTLSPAEKLIYSKAATYLHEMTFIKNTSGRRKATPKKVKSTRKRAKVAKKKFDIQEASPFHAFEAILGSLKMKTIAYLKIECTPSEIREWIYGINSKGAEGFIKDMREPMCHEIINIISGNYIFRVSKEVHHWLFKSGFMKRSNNIFKAAYSDGINFSYSDDILALKNKYMEKAYAVVHNIDFEDSGLQDDVAAMEDEMRFLIEIKASYEALKMALKDIECDEATLKRAKYLTTQVGTLCNIVVNFINETSDDVDATEKSIKDAIEINLYRKQFEPFREILTFSCQIANIEFTKENEEHFKGYYNDLKNYSDKQLRKELHWLNGTLKKIINVA